MKNNKFFITGILMITALLALILALSLTACTADAANTQNPGSNSKPTLSSDDGDSIIDVSPAPSPSSVSVDEQIISVDEQILLDRDNIKITLKSLSFDGWYGPELKVLIENNSDKGITIQTRNSVVNGVMIDTMFSASVEPGKKANDGIAFSTSELERAGITTIKDIEFLFHVFDSDSWDTIFDSNVVSISTNADAGFVQEYNDAGTLLYEDGGLKVVIQSKDEKNSFWGADIFVYVENLTTSDIIIQMRDTSVNGFMIDPMFSCEVLAGKRAYDSITFLESYLTENDIDRIDDMEFSLHIFDSNSWNTIKDTEKLIVSFN